jgi:hypothetical protein
MNKLTNYLFKNFPDYQKTLVLHFLILIITVLPLLYLINTNIDHFNLNNNNLTAVLNKINSYQKNPLLNKEPLPAKKYISEANQAIEEIKNISEKNKLIFLRSDVLEKEDQQQISLQLSGSFLNFLYFIKEYSDSDIIYQINELIINKETTGIIIDLLLITKKDLLKNEF